jgi:hypothetical protein
MHVTLKTIHDVLKIKIKTFCFIWDFCYFSLGRIILLAHDLVVISNGINNMIKQLLIPVIAMLYTFSARSVFHQSASGRKSFCCKLTTTTTLAAMYKLMLNFTKMMPRSKFHIGSQHRCLLPPLHNLKISMLSTTCTQIWQPDTTILTEFNSSSERHP